MKRLLIIAAYETSPFGSFLEELGYIVDVYPLFINAYEIDIKNGYKTHLYDYIKRTEPDIILWWFTKVPSEVFLLSLDCFVIFFDKLSDINVSYSHNFILSKNINIEDWTRVNLLESDDDFKDWKKITEEVHELIVEKFFDEDWYRRLFSLDDISPDMKTYYKEIGKQNQQVPFAWCVPRTFDYVRYQSENTMLEKSREFLWWHYRVFNRSKKYILDVKPNDINTILNECKIDQRTWFQVNLTFDNIKKCKTNKTRIQELKKIEKIPSVSRLLEFYFDINY